MTTHKALPQFPFAREDAYYPSKLNQKLRQECPITKVKLYDGTEAWALMKHKDICQALSSHDLSADRRTPGFPEIHAGAHKAKEATPLFVNLDDPAHKNQRAMLDDAFTLQAIDKLKPTIKSTIDEVLHKFITKAKENRSQPIDLVEELATPIPTIIVYRILGVPDEDTVALSKESEVRRGTSREAAESSNQKLQKYMSELVDKRIKEPQEDLISKLVKEQYKNDKLSRDEIIQLAILVLTAGNAAMINSISLGVLTLLQHPKQLNELKQDPKIAHQVVNELMRYNTASSLNSRRAALHDTQIGNTTIRKGEGVICAVQSGDRDEDVTPNPEAFDIHRQYKPEEVLGFGYGPHRCQGEVLSRTELEMVFGTLFQKCPNLRLAVGDVNELEFTSPTQNMGVVELPVLL